LDENSYKVLIEKGIPRV
jgi:hypothetical protein